VTGSVREWRDRIVAASGSALSSILLVALFVYIGMSMIWSVLAVYASTLGATTSFVGVLIACFGGIRLLTNMPAGLAYERFGRRPTMLAGLLLLAIGSWPVLIWPNLPVLFISMIIQGLGSAIYATAASATVGDMGSPESRVRDMAAFQAVLMTGMSVGPAIGGVLAAGLGYSAPFLLQSAVAMLATLALFRVPSGKGRRKGQGGIQWGLMRQISGPVIMTFTSYFCRIAGTWVLMPLVAKDHLNMSLWSVGLLLTVTAVTNIVILPFVTWVASRFGRRVLLLLSGASLVASLLLLSLYATQVTIWMVSILSGMGGGFASAALSAYVADAAPPGQMGPAMGMLRMATDIGFIVGPIVVGAVSDSLGLGYQGGLLFSIVLMVAGTAFCWHQTRGLPDGKPRAV